MNPKMISLHYTMKCGLNCPNCYLMKQSCSEKEIDKEEWLKLPLYTNADKIAIAVNHCKPNSNDMYNECLFAFDFFRECYNKGIKVDITTDKYMAEYMKNMDTDILKSVDVFSISIDSNRMKQDDIKVLSELIKGLKEKNVNSINANFLITKECIKWLDKSILEDLSDLFDTVHIIFQKPFPYTKDEYYTIIEKLYEHDVFENEKYIIDPCILFRLGFVGHCHSTTFMVDINAYGSIAGCAYDHSNSSIGKIKKISDMNKLLGDCNPKIVKNCPYLEFIN